MPHIDLLELPYFYGIELDELVELIDHMTPRRVKAGEWLVRVGEPVFLNIATHGQLGIHRHSEDPLRAPIVYERKAPTLFGEIELFCGVTSIADVQAMLHLVVSHMDFNPEYVEKLVDKRLDKMMEPGYE